MLRVKSWLACGSLLGVLVAGPSCSDTTNVTAIPKAKGCEVEADCDKGLTCTKRENALGGLCHQDCTSSENCAIGDRCVHADEDKTGSVCQLASESLCKYDSDCFVPLKCGPDQQCRDACKNDYDCIKPQVCTNQRSTPRFCAEPYEVDGDKNLIVGNGVNAGGEAGAPSMPVVNGGSGGSGGGGTGGSSTSGAGPIDTGGVGPGDGGEAGLGGAAPGGSGGSSGSGVRENPCKFDSSGCNPLKVVLAGNGTGSVKSDPVGLDCGDTCTFEFPVARAVVLSAFADEGSVFNGWSGGGCTGDRTCMVTPNAAPTITATFSSLTGPVAWIKTQPQVTQPDAVYDRDGNVIVTGMNTTPIDVGAPSMFDAGTFVVKYSPNGSYLWGRHLAGNGRSIVATDKAGDVIFAGLGVTLGTGAEQVSCPALLLAKFNALNGERVWAHCPVIPGNLRVYVFAVSAAINGDLFLLTSQYDGNNQDFGYSRITGVGIDSGATIWSQLATNPYAKSSGTHWGDLALDSGGNAFVGGWVTAGVDLGAGPVAVAGGNDGFIMKRTSAGAYVWARTFGDTLDDDVLGVATDADGSVAFTGRFRGQVEFPGQLPMTSQGGDDVIVGKYSAAGQLIWVRAFGTPQDESGERIMALANGDFLVSGTMQSSLALGGDAVFAPGKRDTFLVQLAGASGSHVWSKGYGSPEDDGPQADPNAWSGTLSVDADNNLLQPFAAGGPIDFGDGPTASGGSMYVKLKLPEAVEP